MPDPATAACIMAAVLALSANTILAWVACRMAAFNKSQPPEQP